jgi:hypothetical protein
MSGEFSCSKYAVNMEFCSTFFFRFEYYLHSVPVTLQLRWTLRWRLFLECWLVVMFETILRCPW